MINREFVFSDKSLAKGENKNDTVQNYLFGTCEYEY